MIVDNPDNARFAASGALADLTVEGPGMGPGRPVPARPVELDPVARARPTASRSAATPSCCGSTPIWRRRPGSIRRARQRPGTSSPRGPQAMTNKDEGVYGTALLAKKDETGTFLFLPWILQNGGSIDKLDSPEAIEALAFWRNLVDQGWAPRSAVNDGFAEIYQQFTTGKAGMMISGTWNAASIGTDAPDLHWEVADAALHEAAGLVAGRRELGGLRCPQAAGRRLGLPEVRHRSGLRHQAHRLHGLHAQPQGRPRPGCRERPRTTRPCRSSSSRWSPPPRAGHSPTGPTPPPSSRTRSRQR